MAYHNTLVAVDFSDKRMVEKAKKMAEFYGASIHAVYVIDNFPMIAYGNISMPGLEEQIIEDAKKRLDKLGIELGIDKPQLHLAIGRPATEILNVAKKIKADLIFLGSHGHSGLGVLLGSTANSLIHHAHCDVLVIRAKE
jgi:universal stress protein A